MKRGMKYMITIDDIYAEIGIPCFYCKYVFTDLCISECINLLLDNMIEIATDIVLRGDY